MLTFRAATLADVTAIRACAQAAYSQYVAAIGKAPAPMVADFEQHIQTDHVHVAEVDGALAGYIIFREQTDAMLLDNVAVTTPKRGIGRALIAICEDAARDAGLAKVTLYTNEKMQGPLALYPKLGYREVERRREDGFHRVYFEKVLS